MVTKKSVFQPGHSYPLGATMMEGGVNFSVYSKNAASVDLLLFNDVNDATAQTIRFDPQVNKTYDYWHMVVEGLKPGQVYGFRVNGPLVPDKGLRFDGNKILLDPYGRCVVFPTGYSRRAACLPGDNAASAMKSVIVDLRDYDWENDIPIKRPFSQTVIYEMHVGGLTKHPSSDVPIEKRGTYAGVVEKIPYLKELGITAVELLPIFQFDPLDCPDRLINYWGYSPVSFFAPHRGYSSSRGSMGPINEFRDMVKALHKEGIEVLLDVVFNHTAEGNQDGPTFCFRGFENKAYYMLDKDQKYFANYAGTGNTMNANHSVVRRLILDSLRFWVKEMHVDGFRFDLASILSRDEEGAPLKNPPVLWDIESDPVLAGVKLIAEAWDAGGLYQVGSFAGDSWKEWNGKFRDDVRSFVRGDPGTVSKLANRLLASPDIFEKADRSPEESVNFITCHDGFTLNDLVSYNEKHNEANGEGNRDGTEQNISWNCGVEGPADDSKIEEIRNRQVKNFHAINMLALGTPMILMGDEVRRTQLGNNNAYCQDNETSWFDWTLLKKHDDIYRFVKICILNRLKRTLLSKSGELSLRQVLLEAEVEWHGTKLNEPDWNWFSNSLAFTSKSLRGSLRFHIMLNAYYKDLIFELPSVPSQKEFGWRRWMDTALDSPDDICTWSEAPFVSKKTYLVKSRSIVGLFSPNMKPDAKKASS